MTDKLSDAGIRFMLGFSPALLPRLEGRVHGHSRWRARLTVKRGELIFVFSRAQIATKLGDEPHCTSRNKEINKIREGLFLAKNAILVLQPPNLHFHSSKLLAVSSLYRYIWL